MTYEETIVLHFLRGSPEAFYSRKEISRRAVKRTIYEENPRWAEIPLASLVAQNLVEINEEGHYRIKKKKLFREDQHNLA